MKFKLNKLERWAIIAMLVDGFMTITGIGVDNLIKGAVEQEGDPIVKAIMMQGPIIWLLASVVWMYIIIKIYRFLDKPFKTFFIWTVIGTHSLAAATWLIPGWTNLLWSGSNYSFLTVALYQIYFGIVMAIIYMLKKKK